jgi:hypothetical protein
MEKPINFLKDTVKKLPGIKQCLIYRHTKQALHYNQAQLKLAIERFEVAALDRLSKTHKVNNTTSDANVSINTHAALNTNTALNINTALHSNNGSAISTASACASADASANVSANVSMGNSADSGRNKPNNNQGNSLSNNLSDNLGNDLGNNVGNNIDISRAEAISRSSHSTSELVVSITSYGQRVNTVHITLLSLLTQSVKPSTLILWLAEDEFRLATLPKPLLALRAYGLQIAFCADIGSYKKLIPALHRYPNATHVTFDDDIIYPATQLEQLITSHQQFPDCIICHRAHEIKHDNKGRLLPYQQWLFGSKQEQPSLKIMAIGMGGVLYPKASLNHEVLNQQAFMQHCPQADDIWFKLMATKNNTMIKLVNTPISYESYLHIPNSQTTALWHTNKYNNDQQLASVMIAYPAIKL